MRIAEGAVLFVSYATGLFFLVFSGRIIAPFTLVASQYDVFTHFSTQIYNERQ